ncbi:MAG: zinc metallopeptidase, partial [Verrucomicrobiales bacterium]
SGSMEALNDIFVRMQKRFREYSAIPDSLSGREVAERMLAENGINDVQVISTPGQLTDHYNPKAKTVNLSDVVYNERNVAAAAVSTHECGHGIQHAKAYGALKIRSGLVPIVSLSNKWMKWVLMGGMILASFSGNIIVLAIGVAMFSVSTLFSLITLPVEFDASRRALRWLDTAGIMQGVGHDKAKNALFWQQ